MPVHEAPRALFIETAVARRDVVRRLVESRAVGAPAAGAASHLKKPVATIHLREAVFHPASHSTPPTEEAED